MGQMASKSDCGGAVMDGRVLIAVLSVLILGSAITGYAQEVEPSILSKQYQALRKPMFLRLPDQTYPLGVSVLESREQSTSAVEGGSCLGCGGCMAGIVVGCIGAIAGSVLEIEYKDQRYEELGLTGGLIGGCIGSALGSAVGACIVRDIRHETEPLEKRKKDKMFSLGYGCLGAYQGAVLGGTIGYFSTQIQPPFDVSDEPRNIAVGALTGALVGGILGSQARTYGQKVAVTIGASCTTVGIAIAGTLGYLANYAFQ